MLYGPIVHRIKAIKSTLFKIEFQVPALRVQVTERLDKERSEQVRKQQLLLLEESRIEAMSALEQTAK